MKKLFVSISITIICFSLLACGKTNHVQINIGHSEQFNKAEIEAAANCAVKKFKGFQGCELTKLWYDEEQSNEEIELYFNSDHNGDQIILFSDFNVDSSGGDGSFNPHSTYQDWKWILIRDSHTSKWKVIDWGY